MPIISHHWYHPTGEEKHVLQPPRPPNMCKNCTHSCAPSQTPAISARAPCDSAPWRVRGLLPHHALNLVQPTLHSCRWAARGTHTCLCSCGGRQAGRRPMLARCVSSNKRPKSPWSALDGSMPPHRTRPSCPHRPRRPLAVHAAEPSRPAAPALQHAALLAAALAAGAQGLRAARSGWVSGLAWMGRLLLSRLRGPAGGQPKRLAANSYSKQLAGASGLACLIQRQPASLLSWPLLLGAALPPSRGPLALRSPWGSPQF